MASAPILLALLLSGNINTNMRKNNSSCRQSHYDKQRRNGELRVCHVEYSSYVHHSGLPAVDAHPFSTFTSTWTWTSTSPRLPINVGNDSFPLLCRWRFLQDTKMCQKKAEIMTKTFHRGKNIFPSKDCNTFHLVGLSPLFLGILVISFALPRSV